MNKHEPHEDELEPDSPQPWEVEGGNTWTDAQRKAAKRDHLYPVAASLDDAGVSEDEVCRFLTLFGQSIGLGSFDRWQDRLYVWAEKHAVNKKGVDTGSNTPKLNGAEIAAAEDET